MAGKPVCNPVRVNIESVALKGLLVIQSGCISDSEPVWRISAAPGKVQGGLFSPGLWSKKQSDESVFGQLWQVMTDSKLGFIILRLFEENGKNKLALHTCMHIGKHSGHKKPHCYQVNISTDLGNSSEKHWLLSQLAFNQKIETPTISVFHSQIIRAVSMTVFCLRQVQMEASIPDSMDCFKNGYLSGTDKNILTYNPSPDHKRYPFKDWLYRGKGIRILPLNECHTSTQSGVYQCSSFMFLVGAGGGGGWLTRYCL